MTTTHFYSTFTDFHSTCVDFYSTFAKEGGRVGSGARGSGQGGVGRCVR